MKKMTGYELYKRVCSLLGYDLSGGLEEDENAEKMPAIIEQICDDLNIPAERNLSNNINVSGKKLNAMICGCAMLLSSALGDTEKSRFYTNMYNGKRSGAVSSTDERSDVLPDIPTMGSF